MTNSVHTNAAAAIALQNLTKTNERLGDVQNRVSTGLKVQGAKDNAAIWAIAQGQRADIGALSAVKQSLDRATSIADVALSAGESVSDLLNQLKEKVVAAKDQSLKTQSRQLLDADFKALLRAIKSAVDNAAFDGGNILNGSLTNGIRFLANADASAFVTLSGKNLTLGGSSIELSWSDSLADHGPQQLRLQADGHAGIGRRQSGGRRPGQGKRAASGPASSAAARRSGPVDRQLGAADHPVAVPRRLSWPRNNAAARLGRSASARRFGGGGIWFRTHTGPGRIAAR